MTGEKELFGLWKEADVCPIPYSPHGLGKGAFLH